MQVVLHSSFPFMHLSSGGFRIYTASVICLNIESLWKVFFTLILNLWILPPCSSIQWVHKGDLFSYSLSSFSCSFPLVYAFRADSPTYLLPQSSHSISYTMLFFVQSPLPPEVHMKQSSRWQFLSFVGSDFCNREVSGVPFLSTTFTLISWSLLVLLS